MKNNTKSIAAVIALTIGFIATPQVEAQGYLNYFRNFKKAVVSPTPSKVTIKKDILSLDKYSDELLECYKQELILSKKLSAKYGKIDPKMVASQKLLLEKIKVYTGCVDSMVIASKKDSPKLLKIASIDTLNAMATVKKVKIDITTNFTSPKNLAIWQGSFAMHG